MSRPILLKYSWRTDVGKKIEKYAANLILISMDSGPAIPAPSDIIIHYLPAHSTSIQLYKWVKRFKYQ